MLLFWSNILSSSFCTSVNVFSCMVNTCVHFFQISTPTLKDHIYRSRHFLSVQAQGQHNLMHALFVMLQVSHERTEEMIVKGLLLFVTIFKEFFSPTSKTEVCILLVTSCGIPLWCYSKYVYTRINYAAHDGSNLHWYGPASLIFVCCIINAHPYGEFVNVKQLKSFKPISALYMYHSQ